MALLLAILTISFLVALTVRLIADVDQQLDDADAGRNSVEQHSLLLSGLRLAQASLYTDRQDNAFDSLFDEWANLDTRRIKLIPVGTSLKVKIQDLSGRLQVNSLVNLKREGTRAKEKDKNKQLEIIHEVWLRFLLSGDFSIQDEEQARAVLDSLSDWLDEDNEPREYGAEEEYYATKSPGYACANGEIRYIEDLLQVKEITPQLLYGDEEHKGIAEYITTRGYDGKINLNTAPAKVLLALHSELTEEMVAALIAYRSDSGNQDTLDTPAWYKALPEIPDDIILPESILTVTSMYFETEIECEMEKTRGVASGIIYRGEDGRQAVVRWLH